MKKLTAAQQNVLLDFRDSRISRWHMPTDGARHEYMLGGRLKASIAKLVSLGYLLRVGRSELYLTEKGKAAFAYLSLHAIEPQVMELRAMVTGYEGVGK